METIKKIIVIYVFSHFIFPALVMGADRNIYIDSFATNGGDGTLVKPYNELADIKWTSSEENSIQDWINTGDSVAIFLKRGSSWNETLAVKASGSYDNPIRIKPYGSGNKPIIYGNGSYCVRFLAQNHLYFSELAFRNSIRGFEASQGSSYITVDNCDFIDLGQKGLAFVGETPVNYSEYITIKNCRFKDIGSWGDTGSNSIGLINYCRNTIVEDCVIIGNGISRGVDGVLLEISATRLGNGSNHIIRRCKMSGLEENCIDMKGIRQSPANEGRTQIYDNDLSNSNQLEIVMHWGTRGVDIFRNKIHDGKMGAAVVRHDGEPNDTGDIRVFYNEFYNLSTGLFWDAYPEGYGHNEFSNNTCYRSGYENPDNYSIKIATNDWVIKNNIFKDLSLGKSPYCSIQFTLSVKMNTIKIDNNCHDLFSGYIAYRMPDDVHKTVFEVEPNGMSADPLFENISLKDFDLQSDSPCAQKGTFLNGIHSNPELAMDIDGNKINIIPDIGANMIVDEPLNFQVPSPKALRISEIN